MGNVAEAVIANSVGAKIFANFVLKFIKTSTSRKVFTKKDEAEKWLLKQIKQAKQLS